MHTKASELTGSLDSGWPVLSCSHPSATVYTRVNPLLMGSIMLVRLASSPRRYHTTQRPDREGLMRPVITAWLKKAQLCREGLTAWLRKVQLQLSQPVTTSSSIIN